MAASIATAAKPSRAAYLVNQVYWRAQPTYDAVLDTGTAARAAQQARLLGDAASDVGETLRARDQAVTRAVEQAALVNQVMAQNMVHLAATLPTPYLPTVHIDAGAVRRMNNAIAATVAVAIAVSVGFTIACALIFA